MIRKGLGVVLLLALALCCSSVLAAPTLNAASGYVQLPDASLAKAGEIEAAAAYVESDGESELSRLAGAFPCKGEGYNLRVIGGLGGRAELGIGYLTVDKSRGDADAFTITAKTILHEMPESGMALAIGAAYRDWSSDLKVALSNDVLKAELPSVTSVYLVLDKVWAAQTESDWAWKGSLGVSYDDFSSATQKSEGGAPSFVVPDDVPISTAGKVASEDFLRPFVGVQTSNGDWTITGEYKPEMRKGDFNYASEIWSLGVSKKCKHGLTWSAGVTNFNLPYTDSDADLFVDISYVFGQ